MLKDLNIIIVILEETKKRIKNGTYNDWLREHNNKLIKDFKEKITFILHN